MNDCVKLSVIVLTYNHKKYIKRALDSILMQKVNFQYEILVSDDCSFDGTQDVLHTYEQKYENIFRIKYRKENVGATKNLYELLKASKGTYIAYLEGDDYWIDERKLQYQVDFLDTHQEYIGCAHQCNIVDEEGKEFDGKPGWFSETEDFTLEEFQHWKLPNQIATWVHRNLFLTADFSYRFIYQAHRMVGDRTLGLILSRFGNFYCSKKTMSCYRVVNCRSATNWTSLQSCQLKYPEYDDYLFVTKLEQYAKEELKSKINLKNYKKHLYWIAAVKYLKNPNMSNFYNVFFILKLSRRIWEYLLYTPIGIGKELKKIFLKKCKR